MKPIKYRKDSFLALLFVYTLSKPKTDNLPVKFLWVSKILYYIKYDIPKYKPNDKPTNKPIILKNLKEFHNDII